MKDSQQEFHISFFKPTTESARENRNMVGWLVLIWAVAIFGFQIALFVLQKPTPEAVYEKYENSWQQVKSNNASEADLKDFSYATLSVLSKVFINPADRTALENALSWSVYQLATPSQKSELLEAMKAFENSAASITDITDANYQQLKTKLSMLAGSVMGLSQNDVRSKILPLELVSSAVTEFSDGNKAIVEAAMPLYLIHNQSVLTDTKILGFPFHYFYTAVFLLVLFVGLCLVYCVRTDRINARLNIAD